MVDRLRSTMQRPARRSLHWADDIDADAASEVWETARNASRTGSPVWVHGDVSAANLLVDGAGRLSSVLDFGGAAVGDPSCDVVIAWAGLQDSTRQTFQARLPADPDAHTEVCHQELIKEWYA